MAKQQRRQPESPGVAPELVVMTRAHSALRASAGRFESAAGEDVRDVAEVLTQHGASLRPIFGATEERVLRQVGSQAEYAQQPLEDLSLFYTVNAPAERLEEIRERLRKVSWSRLSISSRLSSSPRSTR